MRFALVMGKTIAYITAHNKIMTVAFKNISSMMNKYKKLRG